MTLDKAANEVDTALTRDRGLSYENPFGGVLSYLRRKLTKEVAGADLAICGIPFDQAVTNRPGARFGPRAIRAASTLQAGDPPFGWGIDPLEAFRIVDAGDLAFDYARVAEIPARIEAHAAAIIATTPLIALGGDHSVTLPLLRAHAKKHGALALVQFDAHSDTWADDDPARVDHGTIIWKAVKEGLIDPARSVQIGIRIENDQTLGITRIPAREVHETGAAAVAEKVRGIVGDGPAYVTFDIDALDPAFAPGTGTPVWGGLASWQAAALLRGIAGIDIVGGDVVEVSPPYDRSEITAVAGAHVAHELICLWAWPKLAG